MRKEKTTTVEYNISLSDDAFFNTMLDSCSNPLAWELGRAGWLKVPLDRNVRHGYATNERLAKKLLSSSRIQRDSDLCQDVALGCT